MEMLIASFCLATVLIISILLVTRGNLIRFFTAFEETVNILQVNIGPITLMLLTTVSVLGFLYFFYSSPATNIGLEQPNRKSRIENRHGRAK